MSVGTMLVRSPLAAYGFSTGRTSYGIQVCYQNQKGDIEQSSYDYHNGWTAGGHGSPGRANLNNGFAITGWDNGQEVIELFIVYKFEERVYFIGTEDKIVERCHRSDVAGWTNGELNNMFTAAHYSQLAALSFYDNDKILYIRVYYQDVDNLIHELGRDGAGGWYHGHTFPAAIRGTSIACSEIPGRPFDRWLFYQKPDGTFIEYFKQDSIDWKEGKSHWMLIAVSLVPLLSLLIKADPEFISHRTYDTGAYIACVSYNTDDHRVFTIDNQNQLCVTSFNTGDSSWSDTRTITDSIPFSSVAAIPIAKSAQAVRIYFQDKGGQITEFGADDGDNYMVMQDPVPT
ncbi:hypothetical protein HOY80DRAFT_1000403 [Tuber brumale]|nr:hypothetical protein HOY80DRAFT_1000403 [Tuber brumale]